MLNLSLFSIFISFSAFAGFRVEGEWIKTRKNEYRYVTNYEVKRVKRPLNNFPWIEEDCHDTGNRFASWSKTLTYELTYNGTLNFNLLGFFDVDLGKEKSKSIEFTFQRWVTPTLGIRARHVLHEEFEIWDGVTEVEFRHGNDVVVGEKSYPFRLNKMNYGISVERENVEICDDKLP
jgi:hypothetical protein